MAARRALARWPGEQRVLHACPRPLALRWLHASGRPLPASVFNAANAITCSRIAVSPVLGYFVLNGDYALALGGCALAAASDALDGVVARHLRVETALGSFLDPLADKALIDTVALSLAHVGVLNPWLVAFIVGRDALLLAGTGVAIVAHVRSTAPGQGIVQALRQWPLRVHPTALSKLNTAAQLGLIGSALGTEALALPGDHVTTALSAAVLCTTCVSGVEYWWTARQARLDTVFRATQAGSRGGGPEPAGDGTAHHRRSTGCAPRSEDSRVGGQEAPARQGRRAAGGVRV